MRRLTATIALAVAACGDPSAIDPAAYAEAARAFHTGLAAFQVGELERARAAFRTVTEVAPGEPAGWANLGLVALAAGDPTAAGEHLARAASLAEDEAGIALLRGLAARERGDLDPAESHLRRAASAGDPRALFLLATVLEERGDAESAVEAGQLLERLLEAMPENIAARLERARLAVRAGDAPGVIEAVAAIERLIGALPNAAAERAARIRTAAGAGDFPTAAAELAFLHATLQELPGYRADHAMLVPSPSRAELMITRFLRLPPAAARAAEADTGLSFTRQPLEVGGNPAAWVRALPLDDTSTVVAAAVPGVLWLGTQAGPLMTVPLQTDEPTGTAAIAPIDYDYDFRMDLAVAGPGGLRLLRNSTDGFTDASEALPEAARTPMRGIWAADLDAEGDVDLVAARADGPPLVLRNRGDGRFDVLDLFGGVAGLRDFAWADLDADGDPEAALLDDEGRLHVFLNQRRDPPPFIPAELPEELGPFHGLAVADLEPDAVLELLLLDTEGRLVRIEPENGAWSAEVLGRWPGHQPTGPGRASLFVQDLDNNGLLDVLAAAGGSSHVWLGTADGLVPHRTLPVRVTEVVDLSGEGRLDLLGIAWTGGGTSEPQPTFGEAVWLANTGGRDYYAATLRPRAAAAPGDRRINTFGIGGEIEVRAGLVYQKQPIRGPTVHFGLGERPQADVARILWPNGTVQAEFNVSGTSGATVAVQRLKGSCPWVFAWNGESMGFVTDFLWRTALGLRINAQGDAAVIHSPDWIRIRNDQLAPRDGHYDIRITAELWESHFFDHVSLMAVDHPAGTEVLVDERFTLPAPEPAVLTMGPLRPVTAARDHRSRDMTAAVSALDEVYVDAFERGPHQGVAEAHFVEVDLGPAAAPPRAEAWAGSSARVWLVASGWIYPTDSSINVAIAQGTHVGPRGLRLEVPDGAGGWETVREDLGFPAGKTKTILVDLTGIFPDPADRRLRLRTNMEIYWDRIAWAEGRPDAEVRTRRLLPITAELRYRGFSAVRQASRRAPEIPEYGTIAATGQIWRDLVGWHTRFGDVRPLSEAVDDRYVIMNAGDELALRFPALPDPPEGWTRDFVLIGDGWVKDGDYNTGFSTTLLPLPYHGMTDYATPPRGLENDPAYLRHPEDWSRYHTRWVAPARFRDALLPPRDG